MATFFLILIFCIITAIITFTVTRSLYIKRFTDWYKKAMKYYEIDETASAAGESMFQVLREKWLAISKIDPKIIPEYVGNKMDFLMEPFTKSDIGNTYRAARWLGYDFQIIKRDVPPPPQFHHRPKPKEIRTEFIECCDADTKLAGIDTGEA